MYAFYAIDYVIQSNLHVLLSSQSGVAFEWHVQALVCQCDITLRTRFDN